MSKVNMKLMMQGIGEAEELLDKKQQEQNTQAKIPEERKEEPTVVGESPSDSSTKVSAPAKTVKIKNKAQTKKTKSGQKQVFSFRAFLEDITIWKAYSVATDINMEKIGSEAMTEYINRHKLSGPELAVFEALMAREKQ